MSVVEASPLSQFSKDLTLKGTKIKIVELANNVDPDEVAHHEPPHLNLHCLTSTLLLRHSGKWFLVELFSLKMLKYQNFRFNIPKTISRS